MKDTREQQVLLRPVRPGFIVLSMVLATLLNFIPLGPIVWRPDILAVVMVFWCVHEPRRVSFTGAFICGLVMDVHYGVWLGQHAMIYVLVCLCAVVGAKRILWFGLPGQMLYVFPIFLLLHLFALMLHFIRGDVGLSGWVFVAPMIETLLWVVADWVLLAPQRRAKNHGTL